MPTTAALQPDPDRGRRYFRIGLVLAAVFALLVGGLALRKFATFHTRTYDLAIYDQMIRGITVGNYHSSVRDIHVFAHHVQPVLLVLAMFYVLGAGPGFLLTVQALALALAAVPWYFLVRERLGDAKLALLWVLLLLAYPPFQYLGLADFHPEALAVPLLFTALLMYYRARMGWHGVCLLAAVGCQENFALVVAGWGAAVIIDSRHNRRRRRSGLALLLAGLAYFLVALLVFKPALAVSATDTHFKYFNQFGSSYAELGETFFSSPGKVLAYAFTWPKLKYLLQLAGPLLLLPLLRPVMLLPVAPLLAINLLSNHLGTTDIQYHFSAAVIPFVFLAGLEGYRRAVTATPLTAGIIGAGLVAAALVAGAWWSPFPGGAGYRPELYAEDQTTLSYRAIAGIIPAAASVSVPIPLTPHLAHCARLYVYPSVHDLECDYVVIDMNLPPVIGSPATLNDLQAQRMNNIQVLLHNGYAAEMVSNDIYLLRKK